MTLKEIKKQFVEAAKLGCKVTLEPDEVRKVLEVLDKFLEEDHNWIND